MLFCHMKSFSDTDFVTLHELDLDNLAKWGGTWCSDPFAFATIVSREISW